MLVFGWGGMGWNRVRRTLSTARPPGTWSLRATRNTILISSAAETRACLGSSRVGGLGGGSSQAARKRVH
jgi:hypothetical protein